MLVLGFFLMCTADILVGVFEQQDRNDIARYIVLVFIVAYEFSAGPVLWVYIPEVLNNAGVTLAAVASWIFIIIVSFATPTLQAATGPWIFYIFAICNGLGALFQWAFLIESKGRTRYEMQLRYLGKSTSLPNYQVLSDDIAS